MQAREGGRCFWRDATAAELTLVLGMSRRAKKLLEEKSE